MSVPNVGGRGSARSAERHISRLRARVSGLALKSTWRACETGPVQITGSNPVLAVHDIERSAAWSSNVVGCHRTDPDPGNWVFGTAEAVTVMLGRCPDVPPASTLGDHSHVAYLYVDSVDDFHVRALAEGAEILKAPADEPRGHREMGLWSPDGHRFMLGEALQPGWRSPSRELGAWSS